MNESEKKGSLVCVGTGITLGAHITPIAKSHIEQADIVFITGNTGFMQMWLEELNPNVHDLQQYYQEGKPRSRTYQQMMDEMLKAMREGKKVVGAFYGHPGMFVTPTHKAIKQAKAEGFFAKMEAGISAEDCLISDCGINPGALGCANFEASQFINYQRQVDNSAYLILWQVGMVGDTTLTQFSTGEKYRAILVEVLQQHYPFDHTITLYEAAATALEQPRIEQIALVDFIHADVKQVTTMIIPPSAKLKVNKGIQEKLAELEKQRSAPVLKSI
ncbi:SAM-dependent methyltransferase [Thalassotalea sp. ND16A]|uniref:SAM-dependent methyltransferase n=1 Tax=Thalassotalea sp. ND16A TaxID=1535422 RepID=UPI00051A193C|nr:SAM-dependent methyltransferase [Thalassotalea sp. ND16A]KGJ89406.1 hypothetical protein ND16A_2299 [Thalassotalea sp. ND16A]